MKKRTRQVSQKIKSLVKHKREESKPIPENIIDVSMEDLLGSKLRNYISNLNGLKKGNLYQIVMREIEKPLIMLVLEETKGNQIKASNVLGIHRNTLNKKIKELEILM